MKRRWLFTLVACCLLGMSGRPTFGQSSAGQGLEGECKPAPATGEDLVKYPWLSDTTLSKQIRPSSPVMAQIVEAEQDYLLQYGLGACLDFRDGSAHDTLAGRMVKWRLEQISSGVVYHVNLGTEKQMLILYRNKWFLFRGDDDDKAHLVQMAAGVVATRKASDGR